ncbi:MAG: DEAD/DEAH box helicase [Solirubrobacteraceae bacterium]
MPRARANNTLHNVRASQPASPADPTPADQPASPANPTRASPPARTPKARRGAGKAAPRPARRTDASEPWEAMLQQATQDGRLVHEQLTLAQQPYFQPIPDELDPRVHDALQRAGITALYNHQRDALLSAFQAPTIVTTGTASGKSLCFQLPTLQMLVTEPTARALYLYPTKALAQDQARAIASFGLTTQIRPAIYDGDTPSRERTAVRRRSNLVITNPDMLHVGILPHHHNWAELFSNLAFVVVDEAHVYRGVFGSHVANVLRRVRRIAAIHGSAPRFLLASATIANPVQLAEQLTGLDGFRLIDNDSAPLPQRRIAVWNPPLLDKQLGVRASALGEAAALLAHLVQSGARTICFMRSRRGVELILRMAADQLPPERAERIAPYRAGYTPQQRHEIEARLVSGELLAVVSTDALELGIDIGQLDAAICVTFPGTVASLRQMWGRAGRRGRGLAVYVAGEDALDQFFARHPQEFLARPVEAAIIDPASPEILAQHLLCAAYEAPLTELDADLFGSDVVGRADALVAAGLLRERASGFIPARPEDYPAGSVALRSASPDNFALVDVTSGEIIGTVESARAFSTVHAGAVYLHLGRAYLVLELDVPARRAIMEPFNGNYYTQTKTEVMTYIQQAHAARVTRGVTLHYGQVIYSETVLGFQRKGIQDQAVIDFQSLDLPTTEFMTRALWYELGELVGGVGGLVRRGAERGIGATGPLAGSPTVAIPTASGPGGQPHGAAPPAEAFPADQLLGSLHALEHAQIAVLPLIAMCDRWDIGGLSTNAHPQTGGPTIFIYDGHPGGIGITRRGFAAFERLTDDAGRLIGECGCKDGCPSCVQSPKCGNLNEPLSKRGALELIQRMQRAG